VRISELLKPSRISSENTTSSTAWSASNFHPIVESHRAHVGHAVVTGIDAVHGAGICRSLGVPAPSPCRQTSASPATATSLGSATAMPAPSAIRPSRKIRVASPGSPPRPGTRDSATTPRSQDAAHGVGRCVTSRMVRPSFWNSLDPFDALALESARHPTARTSSTTRTSGSMFTATAKPSRTYMPENRT